MIRSDHLSDFEYPFIHYKPDQTSNNGILFLHGSGEKGSNLKTVSRTGLPFEVEQSLQLTSQLICPQCPDSENWKIDKLVKFIEQAKTNLGIETFSVSGLSMGGAAVWKLLEQNLPYIKKFNPLCAPFIELNKAHLQNQKVWIMHGEQDNVVSSIESIRMHKSLCDMISSKVDVFPGISHNCWEKAYKDLNLINWLDDQSVSF